jgi:protein-L-isoaspartate(D-aspartate) O-methyltransferase
MVERQLRRRGIADERVLEAMGAVPREEYVPDGQRRRAYNDSALPIGGNQTISQPWVVAAICSALALAGTERVLEVGTGSGYSAAVLARLAREVVSVERDPDLAEGARAALARLGVGNVEVITADGSAGLPEAGQFEAAAVHATAPQPPPSLIAAMPEGGRLVVPIATQAADMLTLFVKTPEGLEEKVIGPCRFVPLVGREGFPDPSADNG